MKNKGEKNKDFKKTYIINIDGMRADYFGAIGHQGYLTPTLISLAKKGIRFTNCKTIMPANTGTNHTAIMTSAHAGSHGILGVGYYYRGLDFNHFRLSRKYGSAIAGTFVRRHVQVPTFFNIIKQNNHDLVTAFIPGKTWMGNILADEDCDVTIFPGNTPDDCGRHQPNPDYVTPCEGYVGGGCADPVDNVILPRFYLPERGVFGKEPSGTINLGLLGLDASFFPSDRWVIDQAISCVNEDNPDFMYMILMNNDSAGHTYGPFKIEEPSHHIEQDSFSIVRNPNASQDVLFQVDMEVNRFINHLKKKGLYDESRIIITSDHGMSLMKSVISGISWKRLVYQIIKRMSLKKDITSKIKISNPKTIEELDIDIRKILKNHGIHMRASQPKKWFKRYNPKGGYDWAISDGGNLGYIYNVDELTQEKIKNILENYIIEENGNQIKPIWKVLTEKEMDNEENEFDGKPFRLGRGDFNSDYDPIWPSIIVFPKPHYFVPMYNDQLSGGMNMFKLEMNLPAFLDIRGTPGAHGTYLEQDVPLIFVSPSESVIQPSTVYNKQVSVLDIIPTINYLSGWPDQSSFEGKPIIPISKKREKQERVKPEISVPTSK